MEANRITDESTDATSQTPERTAPVSAKAADYLTNVFSDLTDAWDGYLKLENGRNILQTLKDQTIDDKIRALEIFEKSELLEVLRAAELKIESLTSEVEMYAKRNCQLTQQLHIVETKVGKSQENVFKKMESVVREVLGNFKEREIDLMEKTTELEGDKKSLKAKNERLEERLEYAERKIIDFEKKNEHLTRKNEQISNYNDEVERKCEELSVKNETLSEEIFDLQEKIGKMNEKLVDVQQEAMETAVKLNEMRNTVLKREDEAFEKARRHEDLLKKEMDAYRIELEQKMQQMKQTYKMELENLNRMANEREATLEQQNSALLNDVSKYRSKVKGFEKHLELMECQIKGNVKRKLAVNYQDMLDIVSAGPSGIPIPPSSFGNELLDLARDISIDKENARRKSKERSKTPPSPRRNIGVQASRPPIPDKPDVARRVLPVTSGTRPFIRKT